MERLVLFLGNHPRTAAKGLPKKVKRNPLPRPLHRPEAGHLVNLGAVVVPFVATVAAIALFWDSWVSPANLVIASVMYLVTDHRRIGEGRAGS